MKFTTRDVIEQFADLIISHHGEHADLDHVASADKAQAGSLVFVPEADQIPHEASAIITNETAFEAVIKQFPGFVAAVQDVRLAQAMIKQHYDDYLAKDEEWDAIHATATIHKTARLGQHCRVGPNTVIGAHCVIGDDVIIRANSVIEHDTHIGNGTIIHSLVNIGYGSRIGQRVTVQSGCILGNEGYGFAADKDQRYHRIPHTGCVIIGDDVHIGSNTCIDRGTYGATTIHRGVKIDNLCHIAHNVEIGEDCLLTAQSVIAGSSRVGKRVIFSGQTGVLDHKTITDDVVLVQRAGVTEDITDSGMWAGTPAKPFREYVRELGMSKRVSKLEQRIKELQRAIK